VKTVTRPSGYPGASGNFCIEILSCAEPSSNGPHTAVRRMSWGGGEMKENGGGGELNCDIL
jgi:hypothetical protein